MKEKAYSIEVEKNNHLGKINSGAGESLVLMVTVCLSALVSASLAAAPTAANSTSKAPDPLGHQAAALRGNDSARQPSLPGHCVNFASCKRQQVSQAPRGTPNCYCDSKCRFYGDCCPFDNPNALSLSQRISTNSSSDKIRSQWHCHKVNPVFGDILIKASCPEDWLAGNEDNLAFRLTEKRCEFSSRQATTTKDDQLDLQTDPIGMMMPITDLSTGTTYANSHCLRCNSKLLLGGGASRGRAGEAGAQRSPAQAHKLIYWSPLLECNYNLDTDDRNTLYDLISTSKGQALQYSIKQRKWIIKLEEASEPARHANQSHLREKAFERVCSITATIPETVEHSVRYCRANTISQCRLPADQRLLTGELRRAKQECEFGNQALVYGETSGRVYYNLGCAKCNFESRLSCDKSQLRPATLRFPTGPLNSKVVVTGLSSGAQMSPPSEILEPGDLLSGFGRSSGGQQPGAPISGSFSVLMDLYGSSQGDEQVGAVHQCPDPDNQVYDPFFLTCRDVVCGLDHQLLGGACVAASQYRSEKLTQASLVEKFKVPMVYLTAVGLFISIASLTVYLLLYWLSTLDLRPLVVEMAQAGQRAQMAHNPLEKVRGSGQSGSGSELRSCQMGPRNQSLASRGVACLAGSLLAAYLLFILGHQNSASAELPPATNQPSKTATSITCLALAAGTYFCFLVAFNWMFLLSYDVWRTLRLATCQLRGPSPNSQSTRFLVYSIYAILTAVLVVGSAVAMDLLPVQCDSLAREEACQEPQQLKLSYFKHFLESYRPKFGQRLNSCWFSNRRALALFFGLPVTLIMILNLVFFLHSSCMVIRTSSKSSLNLKPSSSVHCRHRNGRKGDSRASDSQKQQRKFMSVLAKLNSASISSCSAASEEQAAGGDFSHQNGLTTSSLASVQTIQSNLSAASSTGSSEADSDSACRSEPPPEGAPEELASPGTGSGELDSPQPTAPRAPPPPLEPSKSSSSLTNQSVGGVSISTSLAMKYDAHLQNLSSMMNSIVKDYRLYCRLSTIMGLTWLTGLVASIVDHSDALWYLFVALNTLQGLFIFIAFGCKRSKLTNLEILISYLQFRLAELTRSSELAGKEQPAK